MNGAIKSAVNYFGEAGALDRVHAGAPTEPADRTARVLVFFRSGGLRCEGPPTGCEDIGRRRASG
jgi:hypothetical protein